MAKTEVKEWLILPRKQLESLRQEKSEGGLIFVDKIIERHANGYFIDRIIFKKENSFFQFLSIEYLDEQITFTVPYEVFQEKKEYIRTTYTNWVGESIE